MAKKDKGPGCLTYIFFFVFLGCLAVYFVFSNTFDFKTLLIYGPNQYLANIWHFHDDYYCQAESTLKIYEDILPADSTGKDAGTKPIITLEPGKRFKLKGYRNKAYVLWVAAKAADGPNVIYGYFMVPEKVEIPTFMGALNGIQEILGDSSTEPFHNKYFSEIPRRTTEQYQKRLLDTFKTKLGQAVKLSKTSEPVEMQRVKESKDFKIIDAISSDTTVYYCPKNEYGKAEDLYNIYLGPAFDTHYLQVSNTYNPAKEGVFEESLVLRFVDSWYFKGFVALILFWLYRRLRRGSRSKSNSGNANAHEGKLTHKVQAQEETISMSLSPEMSVGTLKELFMKTFGSEIRVYTTVNTKRSADDGAPLSTLRDVEGPLGTVIINPYATVSQIEKLFKDMGIGIQVMRSDGSGLAPNSARLIEF
jgi:hypothetical protein